ncbi:Repressor of RNA polymerase III transcription maf1 [Penicillium longicatenatum]|uniref:Repressor of RNA polymerase III transcription maf1 n=1 Tax=Penicillium longicatenatum TaxID=1561947 RepID=UPI002547A734|nr:Repressor of RNA polymerase III transcription maf1 [Penicillium longicatenatum]KAJ5644116.1 Repressor of RNA polymerase III transcription maf1 [Penicillium longicatenatum]
MPINYLILLSRQGKVRLAKWFTTLSPKEKAKIIKDVTQLVLSRRTRMCNFLEYKDSKVVYRRYASLFFIAGCSSTDNELISLEVVHRYVEQMDKYYGNVCELDIIFNFQKAYFILDELLLAGEMQESSKKNVLRCISQQDSLEDMEVQQREVSGKRQRESPSFYHQQSLCLSLCGASRATYTAVPTACGYLRSATTSVSGATIRVISPITPVNSESPALVIFLPLPEFEDVTGSLNFDTADCHIVGACDLYTTKAARSDRKLYNHIEQSLEAQYESILRLSASLSPPNAHDAAEALNLSRSSPFGPLSEHSSRRTFAYLIATLNASHPDYDFSNVLRPTDFRRERHLKRVMNTVNSTLYNLRPRESIDLSPSSPATLSGSYNSGYAWGPRMWRIMDEHMSLKECSVYSYSPDEDASDSDDGAIWSLHYFFFNPLRKRVCYIHLRAIPILSHTPPEEGVATPTGKRTFDDGYLTPDLSSSKRTRYWLGPRAESSLRHSESDDDDLDHPPQPSHPILDEDDHYMLSDEEIQSRSGHKGMVRAMSEEMMDTMEV